jgi:catechol 2,3-dioxygenase
MKTDAITVSYRLRREIMTADTERSATASIHPATEPGLLALTVADLARSEAFYTRDMGFEVLHSGGDTVTLGAGGRPLLLLVGHPNATPWPHDRYGYTGLYHFAILLPTRADLGGWLRHWLDLGHRLPGQGDHLVSEALYLSDPDGNGIEVYRDRPREEWTWDGNTVRMGSEPVDIAGVLDDAARSGRAWTGLPAGTRIGHVHLQAGDIQRARSFYADVLGFDVVAAMPSALFISAGGYHHHLGLNTWHSLNAPPAPEGTAGLRFYTIHLPNEEARAEVLERVEQAGIPVTRAGDLVTVRDPFGNAIVLQVGPAESPSAAMAARAAVEGSQQA